LIYHYRNIKWWKSTIWTKIHTDLNYVQNQGCSRTIWHEVTRALLPPAYDHAAGVKTALAKWGWCTHKILPCSCQRLLPQAIHSFTGTWWTSCATGRQESRDPVQFLWWPLGDSLQSGSLNQPRHPIHPNSAAPEFGLAIYRARGSPWHSLNASWQDPRTWWVHGLIPTANMGHHQTRSFEGIWCLLAHGYYHTRILDQIWIVILCVHMNIFIPHIRTKVFTDYQMSQTKYNYYKNNVFQKTRRHSRKQNSRRLHNPQEYATGAAQT
jgi:hypothetical protein